MAVHRLIILGAPGSGKGTHAIRLQDVYGVEHISTGDLLRAEIRAGTPLGIEVQELIDNGKLVDNSIMIRLLREKLKTVQKDKGFLLDGFPRTYDQAIALDALLKEIDQPLTNVMELSVPTDLLVRRILGRWIHSTSGRSFHEEFMPPLKMDRDDTGKVIAAYDDITGEPLTRRSDDIEETVRARINTYDQEISSIKKFYTTDSDTNYREIDGVVLKDAINSFDESLSNSPRSS